MNMDFFNYSSGIYTVQMITGFQTQEKSIDPEKYDSEITKLVEVYILKSNYHR
jgi:hypothetical protein